MIDVIIAKPIVQDGDILIELDIVITDDFLNFDQQIHYIMGRIVAHLQKQQKKLLFQQHQVN